MDKRAKERGVRGGGGGGLAKVDLACTTLSTTGGPLGKVNNQISNKSSARKPLEGSLRRRKSWRSDESQRMKWYETISCVAVDFGQGEVPVSSASTSLIFRPMRSIRKRIQPLWMLRPSLVHMMRGGGSPSTGHGSLTALPSRAICL
ncbi:hypothetical protein EYF80_005521 [Liparis tanakae]|uniref:Uncharacterized protein n=1 Tax=Liparis tanakae TaxID=230148 RepID=A0A4Z2J2W7_9TELE|nr:hypothetical protein EYF80_005521 [Liparis tanakae]